MHLSKRFVYSSERKGLDFLGNLALPFGRSSDGIDPAYNLALPVGAQVYVDPSYNLALPLGASFDGVRGMGNIPSILSPWSLSNHASRLLRRQRCI